VRVLWFTRWCFGRPSNCDRGTEKQVRNLLRRSNVSIPEVIGPASTPRGHEVYLRLHRDFPGCFKILEAMGRERGLIV
jgi:hypothetical protein